MAQLIACLQLQEYFFACVEDEQEWMGDEEWVYSYHNVRQNFMDPNFFTTKFAKICHFLFKKFLGLFYLLEKIFRSATFVGKHCQEAATYVCSYATECARQVHGVKFMGYIEGLKF